MPKMDREAREARAAEVAQAKALKQRQLDEAMTQERERQQAVLDRTEKLKAQRLAREEDPAPRPRSTNATRAPMSLTGEQCRVARRLLGRTVEQFARVAGISAKTLSLFEREQRTPQPETLAAVVGALETAGVEFTDEGVRLKLARGSGVKA
jgi:DNA-binding transcriptional regulator YiaG